MMRAGQWQAESSGMAAEQEAQAGVFGLAFLSVELCSRDYMHAIAWGRRA